MRISPSTTRREREALKADLAVFLYEVKTLPGRRSPLKIRRNEHTRLVH
jgi:hypothetical protein